MKIPCICIDARNKPDIIPLKNWINKGLEYHITHVYYYSKQGIQSVTLDEVRLGPESAPYEGYALSRFAFTPENLYKLIELMKLCTELNEVSIKQLLEESNVQLI